MWIDLLLTPIFAGLGSAIGSYFVFGRDPEKTIGNVTPAAQSVLVGIIVGLVLFALKYSGLTGD